MFASLSLRSRYKFVPANQTDQLTGRAVPCRASTRGPGARGLHLPVHFFRAALLANPRSQCRGDTPSTGGTGTPNTGKSKWEARGRGRGRGRNGFPFPCGGSQARTIMKCIPLIYTSTSISTHAHAPAPRCDSARRILFRACIRRRNGSNCQIGRRNGT